MKVDSKKEWIEKGEHDYIAAKRLIKARTKPTYDIVCFLCQQCIEKLLKAFLISKKVRFPKSHDLVHLLELAISKDISMELIRDLISPLSDYAVLVRYPGDEPNRIEARHAVQSMEAARRFIRERIQ